MLYARRNPRWFVRVIEAELRPGSDWIDFGEIRPNGVICCGVSPREVQRALKAFGMEHIPVVAAPQQLPYPGVSSVCFDMRGIAGRAIELFARRGCRAVAYVGSHFPPERRTSRMLRDAVREKSAERGLPFFTILRRPSLGRGIAIVESQDIFPWIQSLPKPCGILAWNDHVGRDVLDICRYANINVPGAVCVLGINDDEFICERASPTLSSLQLDTERAAFLAAERLDGLISRRVNNVEPILCGPRDIVERASTQDRLGSGMLVSLACEYIAQNACRAGGLNQGDIARHFGVSVRTLQMRFKEAQFANTILKEIQRVQLKRVCKLLGTTDRPITEITFASGFNSLSRLKALFRQEFGMSMREYRDAARSRGGGGAIAENQCGSPRFN